MQTFQSQKNADFAALHKHLDVSATIALITQLSPLARFLAR
jgi:hypothetical protein